MYQVIENKENQIIFRHPIAPVHLFYEFCSNNSFTQFTCSISLFFFKMKTFYFISEKRCDKKTDFEKN